MKWGSREREREYPTTGSFPKCPSQLGWIKLKPGANNSILVSHVSDQDSDTWNMIFCPRMHRWDLVLGITRGGLT